MRKEAFQGTAVAIALAAPATPTQVGKTAVTAGFGTYGGQSAVGINFSHLFAAGPWGSMSVTGGVASGFSGSNRIGARVGIGVEF